ncbi:hypothetical protein D3H65_15450 [Paraflavitalea soli]|uniref:Uncharacterized protein n=1 Tax=Paraflavitalea soli TaxID=2315862 RepID=A0A3B7MPQ5_9BACT|nr:hypothetical protein D3H65_15450 [Paraflavitalea soli]
MMHVTGTATYVEIGSYGKMNQKVSDQQRIKIMPAAFFIWDQVWGPLYSENRGKSSTRYCILLCGIQINLFFSIGKVNTSSEYNSDCTYPVGS